MSSLGRHDETCCSCLAGLRKPCHSRDVCLGNPRIMKQHCMCQYAQNLPVDQHFTTSELEELGIACVLSRSFVPHICFWVKTKPYCSPAWSMGPKNACCGSGDCCICPGCGGGQAHVCQCPGAPPAAEHYYNAISVLTARAQLCYVVSSTFKARLKGNAPRAKFTVAMVSQLCSLPQWWERKLQKPAVIWKRTPGLIFLIPDKKNEWMSDPAQVTVTEDMWAFTRPGKLWKVLFI